MNQIFKDLKVIELASVLAGPAVGMFFAELGAQVIKIENKNTAGDVTRGWKLSSESKERNYSAYYCSVNWHKEVWMLDLKEQIDRDQLYQLIKEADIIVANYRPGSAEKLGVDYKTLKEINPRLIYANLTSFGEDSSRPAFDIVLQAETGFLFMNGESKRDPVRMPVALIDLMAAHQLKEGILIALLKRYQTGQGSFITTSLYEAAIASLANQATNWLMENHIPQRMGSQHPNIAPYGDIFYTSDKKPIVLAVGTEQQFINLCKVLKLPLLSDNKEFNTNPKRVKNRVDLNKILEVPISNIKSLDLIDALSKANVPAGLIRNMQEVFENPMAKKMILAEKMEDGLLSQRVRTVSFTINN
ncbi:MAG: crotonobetainyl-CoA:carnitine CoA-transferase CaiB-like acyl-CoA transferase [Saprospiraceae bacterium]|jgi:crotonobetainyl-CoA:carnitine CoA-transferase CaiB-like acyl-CoA transferase